MASIESSKLQKLKINVYSNRRRVLPQQEFVVMYNPDSYSIRHQNVFQNLQGINTSSRQARYSHTRSEQLNLTLIFDSIGGSQSSQEVSGRIKQFFDLCFYMDGDIHEPMFLKIQWGQGRLADFDCRLNSVEINYTRFDRKGIPLRAELDTVFLEDLDPAKRLRREGKNSPDLTQTRIVKQGDTLPLLTKQIYGSSEYYLRVAQANQLDDFRNLTPGQEIIFPPLEK